MTLLDADVPSSCAPTSADVAAQANWDANLAALRCNQGDVVEPIESADSFVEWVWARDGFLSARHVGGGWWSGCSVPARAATVMLRKVELCGAVSAFLAPAHAAQIRVALDIASPRQTIIVLQSDPAALNIDLHCCDFSADIDAHRLFFACGLNWAQELIALLRRHEGLSTPTQFIRTVTTPSELTDKMIAVVEPMIGAEQQRRSAALSRVVVSTTPAKERPLCIVAASGFRLWDDAGHALAAVATDDANTPALRLDADEPLSTSALHVATTAAQARAIVTANTPRGALPVPIAAEIPVIAWLTSPQIPPYDAAFAGDGLLLADPAWKLLAQSTGWPTHRLGLAAWPRCEIAAANAAAGATPLLALVADTCPLDIPYKELELSSHHVLWEMIRDELLRRPFALDSDVGQYLAARRQKLRISEEGFDKALFVMRLILPAYQQGLATALRRQSIALKVYGRGWDALTTRETAELASACGGPVTSRDQLLDICGASAGLVHCWPSSAAHPMEALGKPVLRRTNVDSAAFFHDARAILSGTGKVRPANIPLLTMAAIQGLLP